jgi:hypothetical protein
MRLCRTGPQVEEVDDSPRHHAVGLVGGNAREVLVDKTVRVGILGLLVRVTGSDRSPSLPSLLSIFPVSSRSLL